VTGLRSILSGFALVVLVSACVPNGQAETSKDEFKPEYGLVSTRLLEGELVSIQVQMQGARQGDDVIAFNDCAAAQYAIIRGSGFVRRVKNDVVLKHGVWIGDGVYTLSDVLPGGKFTMDAEVVAANCAANNIPMV